MDPVKTEVKTEDVKYEHNIKTEYDSRGNKTYRRLSIPFISQNKKLKLNKIIMKT